MVSRKEIIFQFLNINGSLIEEFDESFKVKQNGQGKILQLRVRHIDLFYSLI